MIETDCGSLDSLARSERCHHSDRAAHSISAVQKPDPRRDLRRACACGNGRDSPVPLSRGIHGGCANNTVLWPTSCTIPAIRVAAAAARNPKKGLAGLVYHGNGGRRCQLQSLCPWQGKYGLACARPTISLLTVISATYTPWSHHQHQNG
jgi:hypothetical protein